MQKYVQVWFRWGRCDYLAHEDSHRSGLTGTTFRTLIAWENISKMANFEFFSPFWQQDQADPCWVGQISKSWEMFVSFKTAMKTFDSQKGGHRGTSASFNLETGSWLFSRSSWLFSLGCLSFEFWGHVISFHGFSVSRGQTTRVADGVLRRRTLSGVANICRRSRGEFATGRAEVFTFTRRRICVADYGPGGVSI